MNSREVVEAFFAYWGTQDVEMASALFHDTMIYRLHAPGTVLPYGGEWRGRDACRHAMFSILEEFDYLSYRSTIVGVKGHTVRAQVSFKYQHRRTGGILEGSRRLVFRVRCGLITRMDGYHDARLIEAFMRLTEYRMAAKQLARGPQLPWREKQGSA